MPTTAVAVARIELISVLTRLNPSFTPPNRLIYTANWRVYTANFAAKVQQKNDICKFLIKKNSRTAKWAYAAHKRYNETAPLIKSQ
jgi:hypothetical protein